MHARVTCKLYPLPVATANALLHEVAEDSLHDKGSDSAHTGKFCTLQIIENIQCLFLLITGASEWKESTAVVYPLLIPPGSSG